MATRVSIMLSVFLVLVRLYSDFTRYQRRGLFDTISRCFSGDFIDGIWLNCAGHDIIYSSLQSMYLLP